MRKGSEINHLEYVGNEEVRVRLTHLFTETVYLPIFTYGPVRNAGGPSCAERRGCSGERR